MYAILLLKFTGGLDAFPCRSDFDENTFLVNDNGFVESNELLGLTEATAASALISKDSNSNDEHTFFLVPSLSKDRRASTSVETRPGMILRISFPNSTSCKKAGK